MNGIGLLVFVAALGLLISSGSIYFITHLARRNRLGKRALEFHHTHENPIPRLGGVGLALAFVVTTIFYLTGNFSADGKEDCRIILAAAAAMFALGLWDDLKPIGARRKLLGQILIASAAFVMGIGIYSVSVPFTHSTLALGIWAWPVTVLWLVATTNLINLIDGLDGLAGGICLMLMILLTYVGGDSCAALIAAGMIGALVGFLNFNLPPARIYLGDGGAYFLGFLIGSLSLVSSQKGSIIAALIAPLFVLALPILDTSLAILRRGLSGLPLFRADRRHLHHRLLKTGVARREVVLGAYIFTAFFLILGFVTFWNHNEHLPILIGFGVLFILLTAGKLSFTNEWFSVGRVLGNSISMRAEIQFALAQTRWLILGSARGASLENICEDTALIARKLGFSSMAVQMDAVEKKWMFAESTGEACWKFQQKLPSHNECQLELTACAPASDQPLDQSASNIRRLKDEITFEIISELLAEGWVKSVNEWRCHQHDLPPRFNSQKPD
jgi:UDP-GlcNAc:undecaprenyl-phosphate/decaprenyl-phosphate GlcNAc-1-phosphate transferase